MESDRFRRIQHIFHEACDLPPAERRAFLDVACGDDADLRAEVERLLAAEDAERPTRADEPSETETKTASADPGRGADLDKRIGPYRLVRTLGEGGMGIVYEAVQEKPVRRTVALKIIKLGLDGARVMARFDAERQALALMNHPNVARVLDAGSDEGGRPYFVMDYISGIPITDYCDRNQLSTSERIELMIQACDGVQHAHQKGIIHRDLKPSNILVEVKDGKPVPKIIDFGIAKATDRPLTERTLFTEFGVAMGTPEYMSPEQAEMTGLDVDTRTDVYSLGVLLYELLVGVLPFDPRELRRAGIDEMVRRIREETPSKPSTRLGSLGDASVGVAQKRGSDTTTLARQCRGDMDWITMRALEKDRTRRYASASELAADLKRHLANEPVVAGPPSTAYRARKFVRRHRFGVASAATLALALLAGLVGTTYGLSRALAAERQVRLEADTVRNVNQFLFNLFEINNPGEARGRTITAKEVLDRGAERIREEMSSKPDLQSRLMESMGTVYRSLGLYADAQPLLQGAVENAERAHGADSREVARTLTTHAGLLILRGQAEDAIPPLRRALGIEEKEMDPLDPEIARTTNNLGNALRSQEEYAEALPYLERALKIREHALGPDHLDVAKQLSGVGSVRLMMNDFEGARRDLERALSIREGRLGKDHPDVAATLNNLATLYRKMGNLTRSQNTSLRALDIEERNLGKDHPGLIVTLVNLGMVERLERDLAASEGYLRRAVAIAEAKLQPGQRDYKLAHDELEETLAMAAGPASAPSK